VWKSLPDSISFKSLRSFKRTVNTMGLTSARKMERFMVLVSGVFVMGMRLVIISHIVR